MCVVLADWAQISCHVVVYARLGMYLFMGKTRCVASPTRLLPRGAACDAPLGGASRHPPTLLPRGAACDARLGRTSHRRPTYLPISYVFNSSPINMCKPRLSVGDIAGAATTPRSPSSRNASASSSAATVSSLSAGGGIQTLATSIQSVRDTAITQQSHNNHTAITQQSHSNRTAIT